MIVISGSASGMLSRALAQELGAVYGDVEVKRFPDRECYVRVLSDVRDQDVVIVQTTYPDENLVEYMLLKDAVIRGGASRIISVVPYMGYARQDKIFKDGEALSAQVVAHQIQDGSAAFITVDIHTVKILDWFTIPSMNVSLMKEIGEHFRGMGVDMVLAPDRGALDRAHSVAQVLDVPWDNLEKTRLDGETVVMAPKKLDVQGKHVLIVDDIISTGGTIARASEALRSQGAARISVSCTHGIFAGGALERLQDELDNLVSSDTVEQPTSRITAARAVAEAIREIK